MIARILDWLSFGSQSQQGEGSHKHGRDDAPGGQHGAKRQSQREPFSGHGHLACKLPINVTVPARLWLTGNPAVCYRLRRSRVHLGNVG